MNLRTKTLLLVTFPLLGLIILLYGILSYVLRQSYLELEAQDTQRNVQRVQEVLAGDLGELNRVVQDYAYWDDTYAFIQDRNTNYRNSNLTSDIFASTQANFIIYVDQSGDVIFSQGFDIEAEEVLPIPPSLQQQLEADSPLRQFDGSEESDDSGTTGLLPDRSRILLVAGQPILKTDGSGPARGTLIMARYLDDARLESLKRKTKLTLSIHLVDKPDLEDRLRATIITLENSEKGGQESTSLFSGAPIEIIPLDQDLIKGYTLLSDLNQEPVLLVEVSLPRDIVQQGQVSLRYLILSLVLIGGVFVVILGLLLENVVLKRLLKLSGEVKQIGEQHDLSYRVTAVGKDELSGLAQAMNSMLEQLEGKASALAEEQEKAEKLLLNILPAPIVPKLKESAEVIAEHYDEVSILFADIVGFTPLSSRLDPIELVKILNQIFSEFDKLADQLHLEKIKTIGDAYMVASGLPVRRKDHAAAIAEMALSMQEVIQQFSTSYGDRFQIRIGINTGVAVAGVIGTKKFIYDLWGDAVNISSRMESSGEPGAIQVTESTYRHIKDRFVLEKRGLVNVKGRGEMTTYWLRGRKARQSTVIAVNHSTRLDFVVHFQAERKSLASRTPLNLCLVLDRSGSMAGAPLNNAITAAQKLVAYLNPQDILSVVTYDDMATQILPPQSVQDVAAIQAKIGQIPIGGLANLGEGWLMGCAAVQRHQSDDYLNRVVLLTTGRATQGITDTDRLIELAQDQGKAGIVTTTLGFGHHFNEDLLIGMANASSGNFYFIQSPEGIEEALQIELESLVSLVTQNLIATIHPADQVEVMQILNNYRTEREGRDLKVFLGDVYAVERKPLTVELALPAFAQPGDATVATIAYQYQTVEEGVVSPKQGHIPLTVQVGSAQEATIQADRTIQEQATKLRIAKAKEEALVWADQGNFESAAQTLHQTLARISPQILQDSFEVAEEVEQLKYYALQLENRQFDDRVRKELRDQSHQARSRSRGELSLRGTTAGSTAHLPVVTKVESGILIKCFRQGGKLRTRVISEGYNPDFDVLFPRHLREEGAIYVVDEVNMAESGTFYRACGDIKLYSPSGQRRHPMGPEQLTTVEFPVARVNGTIEDLETTDQVGDGVLIQCLSNGKGFRARVVSQGYDPELDVRIPRNIRRSGMLFVVDGVKETGRGDSYVACGKVRRLVQ
jgi:Ca-activated chloride channel family protein